MKSPIEFRVDRDLIGSRVGRLKEEVGGRFIDISPAMMEAHNNDRMVFLDSLKVILPDGQVKLALEIDK